MFDELARGVNTCELSRRILDTNIVPQFPIISYDIFSLNNLY